MFVAVILILKIFFGPFLPQSYLGAYLFPKIYTVGNMSIWCQYEFENNFFQEENLRPLLWSGVNKTDKIMFQVGFKIL